MLSESDVSSSLVWRIFHVLIPRFLVVLTVIFGPILAQILRFLQLYEHVQHSSEKHFLPELVIPGLYLFGIILKSVF